MKKGRKIINATEPRIFRKDNEALYNAITTLTSLTNSTEFNAELYMSMDKICQMIYENHKKKSQL